MVSEDVGQAATLSIKEGIGSVVSNIVESLTAVEVLPAVSINFTYTVLVPSVVVHHTAE